MSTTPLYRFGENLGDVLRGLLRIPPAASGGPAAPAFAPSSVGGAGAPRDLLLVDATEPDSGVSVSLDADYDVTVPLASLPGDAEFAGVVQFPSGRREAMRVTIAQRYARALTLAPDPGAGPDSFRILADGDPQPLKEPHLVTLERRTEGGLGLERVTGELFDPASGVRLHFTVTHNPEPHIVVGVIAGLAALLCGIVVITEAIIDNCTTQANRQCGEGNVKKITVNRTYGFSWNSGSPKVGCGQDCVIECK